MRTIKKGEASQRGIVYSPNVPMLFLNSSQSAAMLDFSSSPDHGLEEGPLKNWSVVVTNPRVARNVDHDFEPLDG